tara:strand:- start:2613 stop:5444 length:2832 start_codon:yes stop_codon:yes gene_type:complete
MAAGYNASSIIGGPLDPDVLKQLEKRESVYTKRTGRDTDQLLYLNSKTGWVKLSSSVNVDGSATLAKNNVLFGGTYKDGSTKPKSGINFNGVSPDTAYNRYESIGFRPMPGITGFRIDSKNRFGTLREASIDFQVWSVEQLTEIEQLYLRPGFTVLLEWGHSLYIDNKGNVQKTAPLTVGDYFTGNQSKEKVIEKIKDLKKQSNQNYDGVFGYIKNFLWSYRSDGGYDCKLTVISAGELIESVKVNLNPNQSGDNTENTENVEKEPSKLKTTLHNFLEPINSTPIAGNLNDMFNPIITSAAFLTIEQRIKRFAPILYERFKKETKTDELYVLRVGITGSEKDQEGNSVKQKDKIRYIRMKDLLGLINVCFLLESEEGKKLFKFNLEEDRSIFLTFPDHIALDPKIAVLPKVSQFKNGKLKYKMSDNAKTEGKRGDSSILNIYLSIEYILNTLDSTIALSTTDATVQNFIEGILNGLTDTLGNINEFGLHYEEEEFTFYVVDRRLTPNESDVKKSLLNVTGLKSTVTNISLSSKLSPNIASMIAISAQASDTDVGEDVENMFRWNEGLEDRIVEKRNVKTGESLETKKKRILSNVVQLARAVGVFNKTKSYDKETFNGLRSVHRDVMQFLVRKYNNSIATAGAAGIIPFDLDITLDGIGGVKIGQAFTINEGILPEKYNGVVGFLITGVSHVVQNNKWNTDLKAQTIIIGKRSKTEVYETDELLGSEELETALTLQRKDPIPGVPFEIRDYITVNKQPQSFFYYPNFGKPITSQQFLESNINKNPKIRTAFSRFISRLESEYEGYKILVTAGYRTYKRSAELKEENPDNAEPGTSAHNYAASIDINVIEPDGNQLYKTTNIALWEATGIPQIARESGLFWGGDFTNYYDPVHFTYNKFNYKETYKAIQRYYDQEQEKVGGALSINDDPRRDLKDLFEKPKTLYT